MKTFEQFVNKSASKNINIEDIESAIFTIVCNSFEEYKIVLEYLESLGYRWASGDKPTLLSYYFKVMEDEILVVYNNTKRIKHNDKSSLLTFYKDYMVIKYHEINGLEKVERLRAEKQKKREEIAYKMKDVDPYGEDEWLDENYKINEKNLLNSTYDLYIVPKSKGEYQTILKILKEKGFKWRTGETPIVSYMYNFFGEFPDIVICVRFNGKVLMYRQYSDTLKKCKNVFNIDSFMEIKDDMENIIYKMREEDIEKFRHLDPYGEDDWLDEKFKIGKNLFKKKISYDDIEQGDRVTVDFSGKIFSGQVLAVDKNHHCDNNHCIYIKFEDKFKDSSWFHVSYVTNMEKRERISNPIIDEMDPYGEDNWYADIDELKESSKNCQGIYDIIEVGDMVKINFLGKKIIGSVTSKNLRQGECIIIIINENDRPDIYNVFYVTEIGKKVKKSNDILDPYGEDDWNDNDWDHKNIFDESNYIWKKVDEIC